MRNYEMVGVRLDDGHVQSGLRNRDRRDTLLRRR
jgi:hypothetical protein